MSDQGTMGEGKMSNHDNQNGIGLIEILIVVGIGIILVGVVVVAVNPGNIIRMTHNVKRIKDLESMKRGIDLSIAQATLSASPAATPFTPGASGNSCSGSTVTNGTGWVGYNNQVMTLSYLPVLLVDPVNKSPYCYYFVAGADGKSYELSVPLEPADDAQTYMTSDNGNTSDRYEVGSDLSL